MKVGLKKSSSGCFLWFSAVFFYSVMMLAMLNAGLKLEVNILKIAP